MSLHRILAIALVVCFAPLAGCASMEASKPTTDVTAWDLAAVTTIASKLPEASEKLYEAVYSKGQAEGLPAAFGSGDSFEELKNNVRLIHLEATHLSNALEKGETMDKTKHSVQRIGELLRDSEEDGRSLFTDSSEMARFDGVRSLMRKLDAYYGVGGF